VNRSVANESTVTRSRAAHSNDGATGRGTVIASMHRRHRAIELTKFLNKINAQVPEDLDAHVAGDSVERQPETVHPDHERRTDPRVPEATSTAN